ncbi:hypothetical protein WALSEDRAFT_70356 [Wallemia mellicola CBS 633.66]|uniref:Uncharacterized protein n=1 Tax=Wallemia mellicola (strain ATCC MYA-4683 / CBS 633.66) TaxID=671144 RepID=I4Y7A1_WALMC|nr:hypothetical protein WALSEDRAFT_70356 [Wallemia mellicola CBS 633.66]EIM19843.1 hypothetical protein WALSEDRAFT_70356 [Wallemia mellicola CBS 633.66]TIC74334.1 hypothetical protein E3Q00_02011 [Wallemia mellicola]|eukprot:XP_006960177.1 hypothetical protein WALSEDRAFT_70356 [Wallemia mellicola CBS 633.66]
MSSAVFYVFIADIMWSNSQECYLERLPIEILQDIIDYEPTLACCMRNLLLLGHKHRFRTLSGPRPVWTIFGKRQTRRSVDRFFLYFDKFLEDNSKSEHVRILTLDLSYSGKSKAALWSVGYIAHMSRLLPKLDTIKMTLKDECDLHKFPQLKSVTNVAIRFLKCTRYTYVGSLLREKVPNAAVIYLDVQPKRYKTTRRIQRELLLGWAGELFVVCQYLHFPNLKRLSIFGRIPRYEFFEAYSYFRNGETQLHKPLDFEFGIMTSNTVLTVLNILAMNIINHQE